MVGIVVCCGDVGVVVCCGDVVVVWSLWFVVVTWQMCGGIVIVSELLWDEGGGAHRYKINGNDERRHRHRSSFGSHVAHSDVAPSIPIAVAGAHLLGDVSLPRRPRCRGCA